ncbi:hypothetical protein A9P82_08845 [Arachidicoccus ginsenosidimutans]|uniref:hypothetical protein n=1 Tax=Arachidicoccus sp. BS20 TaxID=1850526 RepID=UPI0007F058AF|nr:hypothetical protein [Arachidicoccus sp. BS20]ANI89390.1 hypothetical protein A9P82_08845 [Arachidicoccus sp. BS20]
MGQGIKTDVATHSFNSINGGIPLIICAACLKAGYAGNIHTGIDRKGRQLRRDSSKGNDGNTAAVAFFKKKKK